MPNRYFFPRRALRHIRTSARGADHAEICYVVLGRGARIRRALRIPNRAPDPRGRHIVTVRDYENVRQKASRWSLNCLGILHSHPVSDAFPGEGDIDGYDPGTLIFIYSVPDDALRAFRLKTAGKRYVEKSVILIP